MECNFCGSMVQYYLVKFEIIFQQRMPIARFSPPFNIILQIYNLKYKYTIKWTILNEGEKKKQWALFDFNDQICIWVSNEYICMEVSTIGICTVPIVVKFRLLKLRKVA